MKSYAPNYYADFQCIADKCRHSCCVDWEIDIDEYTLADYDKLDGAIGEMLRQNIEREGDSAHFRLTDRARCPFLLENGLCRLILTLGEDSLCHICRNHPRFYNFFSSREEVGLGLCCEEAARLILTQTEDTKLVVLADDGSDDRLWEEEEDFIGVREKLFTALQDRTLSLEKRVEQAFASLGVRPVSDEEFDGMITVFDNLEKLDPLWQKCIEKLFTYYTPKDTSHLALPLEKALLYFIYRHLADSKDERDFAAHLRFAQISTMMLKTLAAATDLPIEELARLYSTEIEYSEENTHKLITLLRTP